MKPIVTVCDTRVSVKLSRDAAPTLRVKNRSRASELLTSRCLFASEIFFIFYCL